MLNYIFLFCLFLSLVAAWYRWRQPHPPFYMKWLLLFLLLTFIVEVCALVIARYTGNNLWLFNLFIPVEFAFYAFLFSAVYTNPRHRLLAKAFIPAFLLFALVNLLFIQGITAFTSHTVLIGSMSAVVFAGLYLYQLFVHPDASLRHDPLFWVAIALVLFYAANMLYLGSLNYLLKHHLQAATLLKYVLQITYSLFFCLFTLGFLWSAKTLRYSSPS